MTEERAAFQAFKDSPSPNALIGLLRAHQDRVFRLCYQVLHNSHDAEDAAQTVLLKIVQDARRFPDPDSFRRWLYRVSLNAALEIARKAARRRTHEARAAMEKPEPQPLDAATRLALFAALASMDEAERTLILEHYFEGESLAAIGNRVGLTPSGVSRKLDRGRESLRNLLGGSIVFFPLNRYFVRAPAAPNLVSGAVVAEAQTMTAVGSIAMASKAPMVIAAALTAVVFLSAGVYYVSKRRMTGAPESVPPAKAASTTSSVHPVFGSIPAPVVSATEAQPSKERFTALAARLEEFKEWRIKIGADQGKGFQDTAFLNRHQMELCQRLRALRALIVADPDGFLAFLGDPANEAILTDFTLMNVLTQTDQPFNQVKRPLAEIPPALTRGLFDLVKTGSQRQKVAALRLLAGLQDQPEEFRSAYLALMNDPDPELQGFGVYLIGLTTPITPALFDRLMVLGSTSPSELVRLSVVGVLRNDPSPEAEVFMLDRLEAPTSDAEIFGLLLSLRIRYEAKGRGVAEDRLVRSLLSVLNRNPDQFDWAPFIFPASYLSGPRLKVVLVAAAARTRKDVMRERYLKAIAMIDQGTDRQELLKLLDPLRQ